MRHEDLPAPLLEGATLRGGEYGWSPVAFPKCLEAAKHFDYACLGGQFQFRSSNGTREMYWQNADSLDRQPGERWRSYVIRSCDEVRIGFDRLMRQINWSQEAAERWPSLAGDLSVGQRPEDVLVFVAYFSTEIESRRFEKLVRLQAEQRRK
jgi:hypothetical protein